MEILYNQSKFQADFSDALPPQSGLEHCYCKELTPKRDRVHITKKRHHHTGFEFHLIREGWQDYWLNDRTVRIHKGECLLLPPLFKHACPDEAPETQKSAFSFGVTQSSPFAPFYQAEPLITPIPREVLHHLDVIRRERRQKEALFSPIIANRVWECLILLFRLWGLQPQREFFPDEEKEDPRFRMAREYIRDNICRAPTVEEVAAYCCVSPKQLNRIFRGEQETTVSHCIRRERRAKIEALIAETDFSLRQISEIMHFSNEYHFHAFFKKHAGITPGAYRNSLKQSRGGS